MYRYLFIVLSLLILMGCNTHSEPELGQELEVAVVTGVAWNQRVELPVGSDKADFVEIQIGNGTKTNIIPEKRNSVVIFKLPAPPFSFTGLPTDSSYKERGVVHVRVYDKQGTQNVFLKGEDYKPFGAVVSGEINLLLQRSGGCGNVFSGLLRLTLVGSPISTSTLCFATLKVGPQGTQQGITDLKTQLQARSISPENTTISRNVLYSTDPPSDGSTDPTCRQITTWLDPVAKPFDLIESNMIATEVNADAAHATVEADKTRIKGDGVTVVVLGTYSGTSDNFKCDLNQDGNIDWTGHDVHTVSIIKEIAPDAVIFPKQVCDAKGDCPSSKLVGSFVSLISQMNSSPNTFIVNASLGGPLPELTLERLFQLAPFNNLSKFLLVSSTGNNGVTAPHYPATNAPGGAILATNLPNVISVAALGLSGSNYTPVSFNTRENHRIFAPGVNLCPATVTFRCGSGVAGAYNDNLGLSGTSFAAPVVAGVAALYADRESGKNFNLSNLLINNAQVVPDFPNGKKRVWYQ